MAPVAPAMAAAAPTGGSGGSPRYICFLCKRKFKSAPLLTRHKQLSELHRRNLQKQEEDINKKKGELLQIISGVRKQLQELEVANSKQVLPEEELQAQRSVLEGKLRQAYVEYGGAQEKLEASRQQGATERSNAQGDAPRQHPTKRAEVLESGVGGLAISVGAATWQGNKDVQEDRYMINITLEAPDGKKICGFCVLDGHSGSLCVDELVESFPRNLQKCLSAKPALTEDHLKQAVTEACVLTDDEFLAKAREREVLDGSTGLLCLIWPQDERRNRMLLANIGDSRAVLCRSQSNRLCAVGLTDDHKPGRADERERILAKGGVVDMQGVWRVFTPGPATFGGRSLLWGLAVSRAFGDLLMKEPQRYGCQGATGELVTATPEIHCYDLQPDQDRFLVLACDGIWDVLSNEDAIAVCIEHRSAELAAHALVRKSFETGSDDNLTAVVVAWRPADEAAAAGAESKRSRTD